MQTIDVRNIGAIVGYQANKTEHSGPKQGKGAYWGHRREAKKESNRIRRENAKREICKAIRDLAPNSLFE